MFLDSSHKIEVANATDLTNAMDLFEIETIDKQNVNISFKKYRTLTHLFFKYFYVIKKAHLNLSNPQFEADLFDFTQTGAKPKIKSSLSSSTSSSLSSLSLISNCSRKNKKSSTQSLKNQNYEHFFEIKDESEVLNLGDSFSERPHEKMSGFNAGITCPLCLKPIRTNLEEHFQLEHHEYECSFCGLLFDTDYILNQHMTTVHNEDMSTHKPDQSTKERLNLETEKEELVCPVCMIKIQEGIKALEIHVESHFTNNPVANEDCTILPNHDYPFMMANKGMIAIGRTLSDSSVIANVDENFEIDQVMTLDDCGDNEHGKY